MTGRFEVYQSLWGMEQRLPGQPEEPPETHLARIAAAGFAGACLDPNVSEINDCLKLKPVFEELGLHCMVNAFPHDLASLTPLLDMAGELGATQVNVIGGIMPMNVKEAVPVIETWLDSARGYPFPLLLETHRNATLNDLGLTLEVLTAVPELRLCADLSHFVVDRELQLPLNETDVQHFDRILDRSDSFQGRIASNQQVQVPIGFPQHAGWVQQFKDWWEQGFRGWCQRASPEATLRFLVELGPPPYAITDGRQRELSDRWEEGLVIRDWVEALWLRVTTEFDSTSGQH